MGVNDIEEPSRVYFDASRLVARGNATPTGIDRVDLAYVRFLSASPDFDLRLIRFGVFGPKLLHRHEADDLIESTVQRWRVDAGSLGHPHFERVLDWLQAGSQAVAPRLGDGLPAASQAPGPGWRRIVQRPRQVGSRRMRTHRVEHPRLYLNTSHGRLFRGTVDRWLRATRMPSVFFVHDLIPIEFPQYNRPREPLRHRARLQTISRHAQHVLVNSAATRDSLHAYLSTSGQRLPAVSVVPLGIERTFHHPLKATIDPGEKPYFVVLGTLEPRKNHALLIEVWRRWVAENPATAARLVVVGRRGWMNDAVFAALGDAQLSRHVIECAGLSDGQVGRLLAGARALLCPSFAEGFSLPVVEALAAGTPVLASDIAAHREVHQGCACLLSPHDPGSWLEALKARAGLMPPGEAGNAPSPGSFQPPDWAEHFDRVAAVLQGAACRPEKVDPL